MSSLPVEQVLCQLAWNTLSATPNSIKNSVFDKLFPDIQAITNAFQKFRPTVAPELVQLLQAQAKRWQRNNAERVREAMAGEKRGEGPRSE